MDELNALRKFFEVMVDCFSEGAVEADYDDFLKAGIETGLLREEPYSYEKHGELVACEPEEGDTIRVPSGLAKAPEA